MDDSPKDPRSPGCRVVVISLVGISPRSNDAAAQKAGKNCAPGDTICIHRENDVDGPGMGGVRSRDGLVAACEIHARDGDFPPGSFLVVVLDLGGMFFANMGDCESFLRTFFNRPD